jgi:hypothetical protein
MKQYHLVRHQQTFEWNSLEIVPDGMFVLSSDAEVLKKRVEELEKALMEKDIEIESLRIVLSDCLGHFEHTPTRPIAVAVRKILGGGG